MDHNFRAHSVLSESRPDGTVYLRSGLKLGEVVNDTNVWLQRWAGQEPDRTFIAERSGDGWRTISYSQMWQSTRAVAQGLLNNGLQEGDTVVVLSGPSVDHAILMQACQMIGVTIVPLAEQYALIPAAHSRLEYCASKVNPAMVYAASTRDYGAAMALTVFDKTLKVTSDKTAEGVLSFAKLMATQPKPELELAYAAVTPEAVAKILFTSGSTSNPKGVPNTQKMMCVNQAQYLACLPILGSKHHTILDWLPWNHTFAGNSNFNMVLSNGMSLYLDDGKPLPALFPRTLENARMVPVTMSLDVPIAHAQRVAAMQKDPDLRHTYFKDLDVFFYAGASLPSDVWQAIEEMATAERGQVPLMMSSWGMTETAPATLIMHERHGRSGNIGVPAPQVQIKLIPAGSNRYELRCAGPNVFSEYLEDPEKTEAAFDDDGYLITGDAVGMIDPKDVSRGLYFDGRVSEDFKLITGTWVQASMMRLDLLPKLKGLAQDIVICGEGRSEIGLLIFAAPKRNPSGSDIVQDPTLLSEIRTVLTDLARSATGSSNLIARALVMGEPPDVGAGEVTAKGSLNIRTILERRAHILARLYNDADPAVVKPE